jgi:hypothetical protein
MKRKPFRYRPPGGSTPRRQPVGEENEEFSWREILLHALGEEYRQGSSISKLYVDLLVGAMLQDDPTLRETFVYECFRTIRAGVALPREVRN